MYQNYGDVNFANEGRLLKQINKHEFLITTCDKIGKDTYKVCECFVNTKEKFVDMEDVYAYANIEEYSPVDFALGCVDFYGQEAFCNRDHIFILNLKELKDYVSTLEVEDEITVEEF